MNNNNEPSADPEDEEIFKLLSTREEQIRALKKLLIEIDRTNKTN